MPKTPKKTKEKSKKVSFEKNSKGYPIARTESGTVIYQKPELLQKREEVKGTHFVLNPYLIPKQAEYPINPDNFWNISDIRNAKKEVKKEAEDELRRQAEDELRRQAEAKLRRQIEEENCSDDSYSNDSDDSYFDDSYSKNSYSKNSNTDDSNTKKSNCTISGGRSQKRRQRSQKIRRRNKKTRRHRKK
jgi:hypothetical protein